MDGQFLPKPAAELLQSHQFNKVPLINGITNDECGYMLPNVKTDLLRFVFPKIRTSLTLEFYSIFIFSNCFSIVLFTSRMDRWDGHRTDCAVFDHV